MNILGTEYTVKVKAYADVPEFDRRSINGYCDSLTKEIVLCDMSTYPGWENETKEYCVMEQARTLRHEIIHAFLNESGLEDSTYGAWAKNEEMVDWIALQLPKIMEVFKCVS